MLGADRDLPRPMAGALAKQRDPRLTDLVERLHDMTKHPMPARRAGVATSANTDLQRLHDLFLAAPAPTIRHRVYVFTAQEEHRVAHAVASEFVPDAGLSKLEKRWQKVFRQGKPSLTLPTPDRQRCISPQCTPQKTS